MSCRGQPIASIFRSDEFVWWWVKVISIGWLYDVFAVIRMLMQHFVHKRGKHENVTQCSVFLPSTWKSWIFTQNEFHMYWTMISILRVWHHPPTSHHYQKKTVHSFHPFWRFLNLIQNEVKSAYMTTVHQTVDDMQVSLKAYTRVIWKVDSSELLIEAAMLGEKLLCMKNTHILQLLFKVVTTGNGILILGKHFWMCVKEVCCPYPQPHFDIFHELLIIPEVFRP